MDKKLFLIIFLGLTVCLATTKAIEDNQESLKESSHQKSLNQDLKAYNSNNPLNKHLEGDSSILKKESFTYLNVESINIVPFLGLGYRKQTEENGFDINFNASPIFAVSNKKASKGILYSIGGSHLFYPGEKRNGYLGLGLNALGLHSEKEEEKTSGKWVVLGPSAALGNQFKVGNQTNFFQIKAYVSLLGLKYDEVEKIFGITKLKPYFNVSYGIGF